MDVKTPELYALLNEYKNFENISISDEKISAACSLFDETEEQIWQEQLAVYGLNRHFMQRFNKKQFYDSFIFGCFVSYLLCISAGMRYYFLRNKKPDHDWIVMTAAQISRIYEHGSQLDDELFKEYRKKECLVRNLFCNCLDENIRSKKIEIAANGSGERNWETDYLYVCNFI